jgi:hypothetical protein
MTSSPHEKVAAVLRAALSLQVELGIKLVNEATELEKQNKIDEALNKYIQGCQYFNLAIKRTHSCRRG